MNVAAHLVGMAVLFIGWTAITVTMTRRAFRMGKFHEFQRIFRLLQSEEAREKQIAPILLEEEVLAPGPWDEAIDAIVEDDKCE